MAFKETDGWNTEEKLYVVLWVLLWDILVCLLLEDSWDHVTRRGK